jgi:NAD(P)H-hydrate epimerase
LNALAGDRAALDARRANGLPAAVLTPHSAEYERVAGRPVGDDRLAAARSLAAETGAIVLLKGPGTVIAGANGEVVINTTGGALLATAGTGDVLTGMIGGLLAHLVDPFETTAAAAWIHGKAAEAAGTGNSLVASDLIAALPRTLSMLEDTSEEL